MSQRIRFTIRESTLGSVLIGAGKSGICAIFLGSDPGALEADLRRRFPGASLSYAGRSLESLAAQVREVVELPGLDLPLALDPAGTPFQERVCQAVREVPAGTTATYSDLARRIGMPGAVRAVAQACGANPIAVAIPCHRIVRRDGSMAGYRWGTERKRELLRREMAR